MTENTTFRDNTTGQHFVTLELLQNNTAIIKLNRPKVNALSIELLLELAQTAKQLTESPPGAVILWGGERIFASGADIDELTNMTAQRGKAREVAEAFYEATHQLSLIPRITIAAISGYALGGGLELALACDFRIAAENAKLGLVEILLGIIPGGGGTQRLARLIGTCRAKELILSGRQLSASEALEIGLINQVTRKDDLFEKALEMGSGFAKGPLVAQYLAKKAIDEGIDTTLQEGLMLERQAFETVFSTKDAQIGLESFLQNGPGKANFIGQ